MIQVIRTSKFHVSSNKTGKETLLTCSKASASPDTNRLLMWSVDVLIRSNSGSLCPKVVILKSAKLNAGGANGAGDMGS